MHKSDGGYMNNYNFYDNEKPSKAKIVKEVLLWVFQIVITIAIAFVFVYFMGQKTTAVGQSMEPTVKAGKKVWINKFSYMLSTPKRGDVIVFKPNGNTNAYSSIKRVIGIPGDTIQIKDGVVYIDGEKYEEEWDNMTDAGIAEDEIKLDIEEYFVLGDNRNNSEDSRYADVGIVKLGDIEGKAWLYNGKGFSFGRIK